MNRQRRSLLYLARTPLSKASGATLAMRRHLIEHQDFEVFVVTSESHDASELDGIQLKPPQVLQRIRNTRFNRFIHNVEILLQPYFNNKEITTVAQYFQPNAIFTVADLTLSETASRLADNLSLPLIVNFQDWWPRGQFYTSHEVPYGPMVPLLERRFRQLYKRADLAFCTSEGMQDFLGAHPNSHILYPIGDHSSCTVAVKRRINKPNRKRQLIYTGTAFGGYGRMLLELAKALSENPHWELVIFGKRPDWPSQTLADAEKSGLYRGFLPFEQLRKVLSTADACLAVMSFEPQLEVMMRTSFTTKVLDYCNAGSPIIMWGPSFCSPIRLIQKHQAGLTITNPDAASVVDGLQRLDHEPGLSKHLTYCAKRLAETELAHTNIHNVFVNEINKVISRG